MIGSLTEEEYFQKVLAFHGHAAPGVILGGHMVEAARARLPEGTLFDVITESAQCLPDAVQILTPCTAGNQWLKICDYGVYALVMFDKYTGDGYRVKVDVDKLAPFPQTRDWFLKLKTKKEQDSKLLLQEILYHGGEMLSVEHVRVHDEFLGKAKGRGAIVRCPLCGEPYPAKFGETCPLCRHGRTYDPA